MAEQGTKGILRRRWFRVVAASVVVLVVLVLLAPMAAGFFAPGIAAGAIGGAINGKAQVGSVSLSWFGGQRVTSVVVSDAHGRKVADVSATVSKSLLELIVGGGSDLGTVTVSGSAAVARGADGTLNVSALAKGGSAPGSPTTGVPSKAGGGGAIPRNLRAEIVLDKLALEYTDESKGAAVRRIAVPGLSGSASIAGARATIDVSVPIEYQKGTEAAASGGSLTVKATADGFADAAGTLTPQKATLDADVQVKDLAVAVADALAGMDNKLVAAVGEKFQASVKAKGTVSDAEVVIAASSRAVQVDLGLKTAAGVLTASRPGVVSVQGQGLMPLLPGLQKGLADGGMTLDRLPDFKATIDSVKLPVSGGGGKVLDLRGGALSVAIETTEAIGSVRVPGADGKPGLAQEMKIAPLKASLVSADLGSKATLTATSSALVGGKSAGVLAVDLSASGMLDGAGAARMPARVEGSAKLSGVATALAQPAVESLSVELAQDVGPELTVVLNAAPAEGSVPGAADLPPILLTLQITSANINGSARARFENNTVRLPGEGAQFKVASAGPLAGRILGKSGVKIESGLPVTLTLTDIVADLDRLKGGKGGKADLRGLGGQVRVETGAAAGKLGLSGQPVKAFELAPVVATVDARDLAKGATIKAAAAAKVDGQPAGMVDVDLTATGLVMADGSPIASLPAIQGEATIEDVATAIAQPFVESMGLDLPAGVGPKLAVKVKASGKGGEASAGVPATDLDVSIKSAGVNGAVALTFDGRTIRKRGEDAVVSLRSPGMLAGKAARASGVTISEGGYAKATLRDFAVVFDERWSPRLDRSALDAEFNVGGFSVARAPAAGAAAGPEPVTLGQMIIAAKLAPGAVPTAGIKGSGKHQGADFFIQGDLQLAGLIGADGAVSAAAVRPLGTIDLNNMPTSLASLAVAAPAPAKAGEKPGMDVARLIREAVGPSATVKIAALQPEGGAAGARAVSMTLTAPRFNGTAAGTIDDHQRALTKLDFRGQVSPELAAALIDVLGAGLESTPKLVSPAALTISATPFAVAVNPDGTMDLAKAGDASFKVGLEGKALANNVVVKGQDGKPRDLGTVGLENVLLTANVPLGSLAPGSAARPAQVSVTAGVLGAADKRIVDLRAGAKVNIAGAAPQGDLNADASLKVLDAAWLDTFLGKPGLLAGGVGPDATVDLAALVQFPKGGAPAGSEAPKFDRAALTASIKGANLTTAQPLKATLLPDRASIDAPMVLKWTMPAEWGNAYALAPPEQGKPALARFTAPTQVNISLFKLAVAMGQTPLKPGVFMMDVQVDSPGATLAVGSGQEVVQTAVKTFATRISGGKDPGTLGFSLTLADAGGGPAPGGKPAAAFSGGVYGVCDAAGKLTTETAKITMNGTATGISTAVVDALAHQGGLLTEALGPRVDLDVKATGLSKQGGNLTVVAVSPRAEARINGSVKNGAFAISQPAAGKPAQIATIKEATPKLGGMLVKGLPVLGSFEKRPEDGPATVNAYAMSLPIDGDFRKLNGQLVVDLGVAHFATSEAFKAILKVARQKDTGTIGQRMEPFEIDFKEGVGTYQKFMIPLGEFRLATSGTIDLVNRQMDVVTYVPFGALADEAAGKLNTGLGKLLTGAVPVIEQATMVPIRTRGSFDKPETKVDAEQFGKEFIKTIRPDRLIKDLFK